MKQFPVREAGGYITSLDGVAVGDVFIARLGGPYSCDAVLRCGRVTPKFADIGGYRFRISDANRHGADGFMRTGPYGLRNATPDLVRKIEADEAHRTHIAYLNEVNWRLLPNELVAAVYAQVRPVMDELRAGAK